MSELKTKIKGYVAEEKVTVLGEQLTVRGLSRSERAQLIAGAEKDDTAKANTRTCEMLAKCVYNGSDAPLMTADEWAEVSADLTDQVVDACNRVLGFGANELTQLADLEKKLQAAVNSDS